ncbi:MAG: hypothetical protein NZ822_00210 [Patescibacteria group bacterium]|nr:hypothetical protein [Patescibacteria group bacterium]
MVYKYELNKKSRGQVFLLTVFVISVAMFSSIIWLSPIRLKIIQIKEMEKVYQAMANLLTALEIETTFRSGTYIEQLPTTNIETPQYGKFDEATTTIIYNTSTCSYRNFTDPHDCTIFTVIKTNEPFRLRISGFTFGENPNKIQESTLFGYVGNITRNIIIYYR